MIPSQLFTSLTSRKTRLVCGVMSGTSADSIDVALCRISGAGLPGAGADPARVELQGFYRYPIIPELQRVIRSILDRGVKEISDLNVLVGEAFANAILAAVENAGLSAEDIDIIGSHGQTVYHHSGQSGAMKSTFQVGDADIIATRTGIPVVSDFRTKDIALGGEGAPLTPYGDAVLYGTARKGRMILNLGGIANITVLDPDLGRIIGFDSGPANAPIDRLARIISNGSLDFDVDGRFAKKGKVNGKLLERLFAEDTFLKLAPPKSSGTEVYGDAFIGKLIGYCSKVDEDLVSTVTEFVVQSIVMAIRDYVLPEYSPSELVVAGGGSKNLEILRRLSESLAPIRVLSSDDCGVSASAREAMAFAILANDALFGLPTSLPNVTGASRSACLGKFSFPV